MAYNRGKKVPTFDLEFVTINIWKHSQKAISERRWYRLSYNLFGWMI